MITLFRRIRERLIASGSVSKYLLYAVGEILLVVIGILIALQINNWNQQRLDRIGERTYLERMIKELETDMDMIANQIEGAEKRLAEAESLLAFVQGSEEVRDPIHNLIEAQSISRFWDPVFSTNTYQDLINTGNFILISNPDVSDAIRSYYSSITYTWFDSFRERRNALLPVVVDAIPLQTHKEILLTDSLIVNDSVYNLSLTKTEAMATLEIIIQTPAIEQRVKNVARSHLIHTLVMEQHMKRAKTLIQALNEYLLELK